LRRSFSSLPQGAFLPEFVLSTDQLHIEVSVTKQRLRLLLGEDVVATYRVSTSRYGCGQRAGSQCTPLGAHVIAESIGANTTPGTVFVGREPTGEVWSEALAAAEPGRDWILSRILWLAGTEPGINQGSNSEGSCDSQDRYIYIHGTSDLEPLGVPLSHGCVRMNLHEVTELADRVAVGTHVSIVP
jgi:lipoprotein-anchoring transpeptidase ErfK/SrfK